MALSEKVGARGSRDALEPPVWRSPTNCSANLKIWSVFSESRSRRCVGRGTEQLTGTSVVQRMVCRLRGCVPTIRFDEHARIQSSGRRSTSRDSLSQGVAYMCMNSVLAPVWRGTVAVGGPHAPTSWARSHRQTSTTCTCTLHESVLNLLIQPLAYQFHTHQPT